EEAMTTARAEYARLLPTKVEELAHHIQRARSKEGDESLLREVRWRAHKLRGTAGCYGFADVGESAGVVEDALPKTLSRDGSERDLAWSLIEGALGDARRAVERSIRELSRRRGTSIGVDGGRLLVVDADPVFVASLEDVGRAQLVEVLSAAS